MLKQTTNLQLAGLLVSLLLTHSQPILSMAGHSVHMIMTMIQVVVGTVLYELTMQKTMEDGGTMIVGILTQTSTTILLSMDPSAFLILGTIQDG